MKSPSFSDLFLHSHMRLQAVGKIVLHGMPLKALSLLSSHSDLESSCSPRIERYVLLIVKLPFFPGSQEGVSTPSRGSGGLTSFIFSMTSSEAIQASFYACSLIACGFTKQEKSVKHHQAQVSTSRERGVARGLRHCNRRRISRIRTRRLNVRRRRRLVEARRQAEAVLDVDLEGHPALALNAIVAVGEVVVWTFYGQRNGDGQRLAETIGAAVVDEGAVIGVIGGAVPVRGHIVSLNHGLVRIRVEN
ncbi:uncharacterized protein G2W53_001608 [Senna tora]|uniref:Uncharacterized protein n=1 Tax=Senna tora TaxID=362788 RepID=A0A834XG30_9FABA|nr:uncharacterized protein G2W53_001608 [Senna tora]